MWVYLHTNIIHFTLVSCTTGSCRMMLPLIYLVYCVKYLVCLLMTRTIRLENIAHKCMLVWDLRFTITTLVLRLHLWVRCIFSINPRLPSLVPSLCISPQTRFGIQCCSVTPSQKCVLAQEIRLGSPDCFSLWEGGVWGWNYRLPCIIYYI